MFQIMIIPLFDHSLCILPMLKDILQARWIAHDLREYNEYRQGFHSDLLSKDNLSTKRGKGFFELFCRNKSPRYSGITPFGVTPSFYFVRLDKVIMGASVCMELSIPSIRHSIAGNIVAHILKAV